jgi:imidazoleglycerol-phosphate dehydratase
MTTLTRTTGETQVRVTLSTAVDGDASAIMTTEPFLDHMLRTLAHYAGLHLDIDAIGDLKHHLVEDVAITLGAALRHETPATCARYGSATIPMDDALVQAVLDLGGRHFYQGPLPSRLYDHFLRTFAENAGLTLHVRVLRGRDRHHVVEAAVKAVGLALRQALKPEGAVFSTKGAVSVVADSDAGNRSGT